MRVLAGRRDLGEERVVETRLRAALFQQLHDLKRRALARVVDILLVGDADDQDARALERPARRAR